VILLLSFVDPTTLRAVDKAGGNVAAAENSKLSNQDEVQLFTDVLTQGVTDLSRNRQDQTSCSPADKERRVKKFFLTCFIRTKNKLILLLIFDFVSLTNSQGKQNHMVAARWDY